MFAILLSLLLSDSVYTYYTHERVADLERLRQTETSRTEQLLVTYRLYPLTRNKRLLANIPQDAPSGTSARELAFLSALWGYRILGMPPWKMVEYGRRSERFLQRAKALNANDPFVLLVEGQALLFKPALFGGDKKQALARFRQLESVLKARGDPNVGVLEARVWQYVALLKMEDPEAERLRKTLLTGDVPPLFRKFLSGEKNAM